MTKTIPLQSAAHALLAKDERLDHFVREKDGVMFAGRHFIIDVWGAEGLDDIDLMRNFLLSGTEKCGATLLHMHLHRFSPNDGLSGVAVLAESHISFHTWPELRFGAFDVFMCGDAKPHLLVAVVREFFRPDSIEVKDFKRGAVRGVP